ncbi:MAG: Tyrosine-specific transport protein [Chlamydiales bacterium]|nr:Tyrosine-specific transport protein [Chlamydiales bacterium]
MTNKGSVLGATLLVAGTCIGGGMLALPIATGVSGFFPSLLMILLGWAFMTTTALFLAEVNLWMEPGSHVIAMASRFLGPLGKVIAWVLYLFIGYASLVAYTAGGGEMFATGIQFVFGVALPLPWALFLFVAVFGTIIYLGNVIVGRVNTFLMFGLITAYFLLIATGSPYVKWGYLLRGSFGNTLIAVPLLLTIFSFQTIIPSLTIYLKQDAKALRRSIIFGSTTALAVYVIWEWLVLGTVLLDGDYGLAKALEMGKPVSEFLGVAVGNKWLGGVADFFAFFALVTSFLGIALGLFDFLADGLKIKRSRLGNISLGLLIAIPTLFFAIRMENAFLTALDSSGGIGDAILNGLFPALMLWVGRYQQNLHSEYRTPGGKPLIICAIGYALFVFVIELLGQFGLIVSLGG